MTSELKDLIERQRNMIVNTCNVVGCNKCPYKWGGGCSSSDLQEEIDKLEMKEYFN